MMRQGRAAPAPAPTPALRVRAMREAGTACCHEPAAPRYHPANWPCCQWVRLVRLMRVQLRWRLQPPSAAAGTAAPACPPLLPPASAGARARPGWGSGTAAASCWRRPATHDEEGSHVAQQDGRQAGRQPPKQSRAKRQYCQRTVTMCMHTYMGVHACMPPRGIMHWCGCSHTRCGTY
jgi:hypothetical protein